MLRNMLNRRKSVGQLGSLDAATLSLQHNAKSHVFFNKNEVLVIMLCGMFYKSVLFTRNTMKLINIVFTTLL